MEPFDPFKAAEPGETTLARIRRIALDENRDAFDDGERAELEAGGYATMGAGGMVLTEKGRQVATARGWMKAVQLDPDAHPGAMLALMLTPEQQAEVTAGVPGRLAQEADHCTLVYLAQDAAALAEAKPAILAALATFVAALAPLTVPVSGYGRFQGDGAQYPAILLLDSAALAELREGLLACLAGCGVTVTEPHGFTPHITLAYLPADRPLPSLTPPATALTFAAVSLVWAGERIDLPMQGTLTPDAAEEAAEGPMLCPDCGGAMDGTACPACDLAPMASLGLDGAGAALVPEQFKAADIVHAAPAFKSLPLPDPTNPYRIRKYLVVWGGQDLIGDTFERGYTDLGLTRSVKGMPVFYDHAQRGIKSQIGTIVGEEEDDGIGLVVEIELDRSRSYVNDVLALERQSAAGSSSGAVGHTVLRKGGKLKRWHVGELSLTPTPMEPRTHPAFGGKSMLDGIAPATQEAQTKMDEPTTGAPDISALQAEVTGLRNELAELKAMPAVAARRAATPADAVADLGGAVGGGLHERRFEAPSYHNFKAAGRTVSRAGSPTRPAEYPEGIFGGFVKAVFNSHKMHPGVARDALKALAEMYGVSADDDAAKSLGTSAGVSGAFLIPEQFYPQLMQVAAQSDVLYGSTMVIPMDSNELVIPALNHGGAFVEGQSTYYGGVTVTWGSDDASSTDTEPKFDQVRLRTNALKASTRIKNQLMMRSAIAIDAVVSNLLGGAIGRARDYAIIRGTGNGQPLGFVNAPATIDQGGSAIDFATLAGMEDNVIPERDANYLWLVHTKKRSSINALQQTNNTLVTYLPDLRGKPGRQLLGREVRYSDKLPFVSGDVSNTVNLIDPTAIVVGEFQGIALAVSDQARFEQDETVIRAILSIDAQPWLKNKIQVTSTPDYVSGYVTI